MYSDEDISLFKWILFKSKYEEIKKFFNEHNDNLCLNLYRIRIGLSVERNNKFSCVYKNHDISEFNELVFDSSRRDEIFNIVANLFKSGMNFQCTYLTADMRRRYESQDEDFDYDKICKRRNLLINFIKKNMENKAKYVKYDIHPDDLDWLKEWKYLMKDDKIRIPGKDGNYS